MIDERHEELAALYALDLLEGPERLAFEATLSRDAALQDLVREFRNSATALAYSSAKATPPTDLRDRVLKSFRERNNVTGAANLVRPQPSVFRAVLPWAAAAGFALVAFWFGARYVGARNENELLRQQQSLADVALKTTQVTLEAERTVSQRELATITSITRQLADATQRVSELSTQREALTRNALEAREQLATRERDLAETRTRLAEREQSLAALTQQIEAVAVSRREIEQRLAAANQDVAKLTADLKEQGALSDLKITALTSLLKNSPEAVAVAVWDPRKREGILKVAKLPALPADQDYQLWIVDPRYKDPVDAGVFSVTPTGGESTVTFRPRQPVNAINAFAVTRERKGGVPKAAGPFVLQGK